MYCISYKTVSLFKKCSYQFLCAEHDLEYHLVHPPRRHAGIQQRRVHSLLEQICED